jgi:methionyl aminopeptidase
VTVPVGTVALRIARLAAAAQAALRRGLEAARAGAPLNAIGAAVDAEARRRGCTVLGELTGHGIGRAIHEEPTVPSVFVAELDAPLADRTVMTIEPILALGSAQVRAGDDGPCSPPTAARPRTPSTRWSCPAPDRSSSPRPPGRAPQEPAG